MTPSGKARSALDATVPDARARRTGPWFILGAVLWIVAAGAGMSVLTRYANAPGPAGEPPRRWPPDSAVERRPDRPALLMFAHPHCPCTRASVEELNHVMGLCPGAADCVVLFVRPEGVDDHWVHTNLWASAAAIPGCTVREDAAGTEARRFGAATSGAVVLYSAAGELRYHGGITAARGHSGDNAGRSAVTAALRGEAAPLESAPTFGCELFDSARIEPTGGRTAPCCSRP